eukprot:9070697-Alexandrium_andersonii.AAC.1
MPARNAGAAVEQRHAGHRTVRRRPHRSAMPASSGPPTLIGEDRRRPADARMSGGARGTVGPLQANP